MLTCTCPQFHVYQKPRAQGHGTTKRATCNHCNGDWAYNETRLKQHIVDSFRGCRKIPQSVRDRIRAADAPSMSAGVGGGGPGLPPTKRKRESGIGSTGTTALPPVDTEGPPRSRRAESRTEAGVRGRPAQRPASRVGRVFRQLRRAAACDVDRGGDDPGVPSGCGGCQFGAERGREYFQYLDRREGCLVARTRASVAGFRTSASACACACRLLREEVVARVAINVYSMGFPAWFIVTEMRLSEGKTDLR